MIESEPEVADLLVRSLGARVVSRADHASDGQAGLAMAEAFDYALIAFELMVPRLGGPKLCGALREATRSPLLAVTARADAVAALLGTQRGFDDYVFKPVVEEELAAKAQALLARSAGIELPSTFKPSDLRLGDVSFRAGARAVIVEGRTVSGFSLAEFELLHFLAGHAGASFSEEEILATLWRLRSPVRLKQLSVDLRRLQQKLRGPVTGFRYLAVTDQGRMRFDIPDPASEIKVGRADRAGAMTPW